MSPQTLLTANAHNKLALQMLQLGRTTGCEKFLQQFLSLLLSIFKADHGAITLWHPGGFVAAVGSGYDLQAMSAEWHAVSKGEFDFLSAAMHAQPGSAITINTQDTRWDETLAKWREFLERYDIAQVLGVAIEFEGSQTWAHLNLNRHRSSPLYTQHDLNTLTQLTPHIREAMLVNRLFAGAMQDLRFDDQLAIAVADTNGWILFPNSAFISAWETLPLDKSSGPCIPQDWLNQQPQAIRLLSQAGWRMTSAPCAGGLRVELHRASDLQGQGQLTKRQLEIAQLYCQGLTCKEIGNRMHLSQATVRVHLRNAYERVGVNNRAQLRTYIGLKPL